MKQKLHIIIAALTAAFLLASCGETNTTTMTVTNEKTPDELAREYRKKTDEKIAEIKSYGNIEIPDGATVYYVSPTNGKNTNDGKSPDTPWKKLTDQKNEELKPGDYVLLERGTIYRGSIIAVSGVTYSSYGEGEKPMIFGYSHNVGDPKYWRETDEACVWELVRTFGGDIGNIVFNGETMAFKLNIDYNDDGTMKVHETGRQFSSYHDITDNMTFWHDPHGGRLYLRFDEGNPGEICNDIEIAPYCFTSEICIKNTNDVVIDNIIFKYAGSHAIAGGNAVNLTVRRCEFYFIGGSIQYPEKLDSARFGNGVEIFGNCDGYLIEDCYFDNIYDAAVTFQWTQVNDVDTVNVMKNITFRNNVMERCNYSIEYFQNVGDEGTYIGNITLEGNMCWYAGEGLCTQRPDPHSETHIKSWWGHPNDLEGYFNVKNNVFAYSDAYLVQINAKDPNDVPELDGNVYIKTAEQPVLSWLGELKTTVDKAFASCNDKNPTVIVTETKITK